MWMPGSTHSYYKIYDTFGASVAPGVCKRPCRRLCILQNLFVHIPKTRSIIEPDISAQTKEMRLFIDKARLQQFCLQTSRQTIGSQKIRNIWTDMAESSSCSRWAVKLYPHSESDRFLTDFYPACRNNFWHDMAIKTLKPIPPITSLTRTNASSDTAAE